MRKSREIALRILARVDIEGAYASILLDVELRGLSCDARDKSLITELVYGVLRWRRTLDWYVEQVSNKPLKKMHPWLRRILWLGAYQILFLDKIPPSAAINESVTLAGTYGRKAGLPARTAKGLVNGILRSLHRSLGTLRAPDTLPEPVARLSTTYSFPEWLVSRWISRFGVPGAEDACRINNVPPALSVRVNSLKTSLAELEMRLRSHVETIRPLPYALPGLAISGHASFSNFPEYQQGLFTVQNASSLLIGLILDPQPGESILDACAGTGTKTTHLAELMQNKGSILALDVHAGKLTRLQHMCGRLGVTIVETHNTDATQYTPQSQQYFDRVLVDAPCSGLGVLRRHPEAKWTTQESNIFQLQNLQQRILDHMAACVRPGGVLVYSTCTTEPEENQHVIEAFLHTHSHFQTESVAPLLPGELRQWVMPEGWLLIDPLQPLFDGFFGARLRRNEGARKRNEGGEGGVAPQNAYTYRSP